MFAYVVFVYSLAIVLRYGNAIETILANVNASCSPTQTECAFGCCPYAEAECCADGFECCQKGQTCIPFVGICLGLKEKNGKSELVSTRSTPIKSSITACPSGTTTCGPDKCCIFPRATCCSDGQHCCPEGYRCDVPSKKCIKNSDNDIYNQSRASMSEISSLKMSHKSAYKSCPGSARSCPSYMSCCINDNGDWNCCPNPSLPQISYGAGQCCDTMFGHLCCTDFLPICTWKGCV